MLLLTFMQCYKSGIAIVLFPDHTTNSQAIYLKNFKELNFVVQDESAKTVKIMHLENLALYSSYWLICHNFLK